MKGDPSRIVFGEARGDLEIRDGQLVIAGYCFDEGGSICVGDRFTRGERRDGSTFDADLGVVDIGFYGQFVLDVSPGLSAILYLVGESKELVTPGTILRGEVDRGANKVQNQ